MTDPMLVHRRIRNRIIEYLELVSSPEAQFGYQERVPAVHVPSEVINQWEDWISGEPSTWPEALSDEVYSSEEIAAMQEFHAAWDTVAKAAPDPATGIGRDLEACRVDWSFSRSLECAGGLLSPWPFA